jgi:DNA-binding transcriptional ArsR family regulator
MKYKQAKIRADVLKALSHPARVLIVNALAGGDRCVSDLNKLVAIGQSNISRHLEKLRKTGLVADRRIGPKVYYHLQTPDIVAVFQHALNAARSWSRQEVE